MWLGLLSVLGGGSVLVSLLFVVAPIVGICGCSVFCCALLCVPSGFAVVLVGRNGLVALLGLSSLCLVIVVWLFLAVPWVCLQIVIVVFPDHTHFIFFDGHTCKLVLFDGHQRR